MHAWQRRTNLGESTELGKNSMEFVEHSTVYLVTTEAPHGLRPYRYKNQSTKPDAKWLWCPSVLHNIVESQRYFYHLASHFRVNIWLCALKPRLMRCQMVAEPQLNPSITAEIYLYGYVLKSSACFGNLRQLATSIFV
jgi:hypothetical protein